jgi:hypothetical protein
MHKQWLTTQIAQMINVKKEGDDSISGPNQTTIHNAEQHVVRYIALTLSGEEG